MTTQKSGSFCNFTAIRIRFFEPPAHSRQRHPGAPTQPNRLRFAFLPHGPNLTRAEIPSTHCKTNTCQHEIRFFELRFSALPRPKSPTRHPLPAPIRYIVL